MSVLFWSLGKGNISQESYFNLKFLRKVLLLKMLIDPGERNGLFLTIISINMINRKKL